MITMTTLGKAKPLMDAILNGFHDQYLFVKFGSGYVTQKGFASMHDYERFRCKDNDAVMDLPVKFVYWGNTEDGTHCTVMFLENGEIFALYETHPDDHICVFTEVGIFPSVEAYVADCLQEG